MNSFDIGIKYYYGVRHFLKGYIMKQFTDRLIIRDWDDEDLDWFAQLNADAKVMQYFPNTLTREQSDAYAQKVRQEIEQRGWGFWAVEEQESHQFIGFVGLHLQENKGIPYTPMVEIGWRLHHRYWGKGYAPEAARFALRFAFEQLSTHDVYAFTARCNKSSLRVMQKIGMHDTGDDFEHPSVEEGSPLRLHCLYRISIDEWNQQQSNQSS